MNPLVSIIISAYNAAAFLDETLRSVLHQHYKNIEIIVVNDGSTDNTAELLEKYREQGVLIINQDNKGQDAALNEGYRHSHGELIKFMDSDDIINPEMIVVQVNCLNDHSDHIAYSEWARFYSSDHLTANFTPLDYWKDASPMDFLTSRPEGVMLQCASMLVPRKLVDKAGLWDERLILFNDTEFYTRVILESQGVKFTPGARLYYRSNLSTSISAQRSRKYFESTYLGACLFGDRMLAYEDSYRVRNLISNMLQYRYYDMYPEFADLGKLYMEKIIEYGCVSIKPEGGMVFKILSKLLGWKRAKSIQKLFYKIGYLKIATVFKKIGRSK